MAATEALLTWSGFVETEEEESMATMRARLQAMTWAAQAKDAALQDMQSQLQAALQDAKQARAREAALLRRAEKSEEAEEALASQMAELEAEAFTRITELSNKLLAAAAARHVEPASPSPLVGELERRLQAALEDAAAWVQRCKALEEEAEQGRVREAALQRRAEIAEAGEEALATQMAEVEAEAFTRITGASKPWAHGEQCEEEEAEAIVISRQVGEELERRLAKAEEELKAAEAKLRQAEEKNRWLEVRQVEEGEKAVTLKRRQGGGGGGESDVLSVPLQDLAQFVKLKLWNPSTLSLIPSPC